MIYRCTSDLIRVYLSILQFVYQENVNVKILDHPISTSRLSKQAQVFWYLTCAASQFEQIEIEPHRADVSLEGFENPQNLKNFLHHSFFSYPPSFASKSKSTPLQKICLSALILFFEGTAFFWRSHFSREFGGLRNLADNFHVFLLTISRKKWRKT